jgi:hypothetical protein
MGDFVLRIAVHLNEFARLPGPPDPLLEQAAAEIGIPQTIRHFMDGSTEA